MSQICWICKSEQKNRTNHCIDKKKKKMQFKDNLIFRLTIPLKYFKGENLKVGIN